MELCDLMRHGKAHPAGVIAAPVGFVHVKESKYMVNNFYDDVDQFQSDEAAVLNNDEPEMVIKHV